VSGGRRDLGKLLREEMAGVVGRAAPKAPSRPTTPASPKELRRLSSPSSVPSPSSSVFPSTLELEVGGETILIGVSRSSAARRLSLRVDLGSGSVMISAPSRASFDLVERFAKDHVGWIAARLSSVEERIVMAPGVDVPLLGRLRRIVHDEAPGAIPGARLTDDEIVVTGSADRIPRRVEALARSEAERALSEAAERYAVIAGRRVRSVTVKEVSSRWGSCSSSGDLCFSWRLVFAPTWILEYVAAHEAAHLAEMNHGPAFWRLVRKMGVDAERARRWLRREGPGLRRFSGSAS
jgi:predicted metal-dependent hydrolase